MLSRTLLSLVVILAFHRGYSQTAKTDSVLNSIETIDNVKERVDRYNALASELSHYNSHEALRVAERAFEESKKHDYVDGMRYALILRAVNFYTHGKFRDALDLYHQSGSLNTAEDELTGYNMIMIGNVYQSMARYDSAQYFYDNGIRILESLHTTRFLAYAYKNLGKLNALQWKNEEAENILLKAYSLYEKKRNEWGMADTWFSLADVRTNMGDYKEAYRYIDQACQIADATSDRFLVLYCLINRGEINFTTGEYAEALNNLFTALEQMDSIEQPETLARLYQDIGDVYEALGQNESALKYYLESLKIAESIGVKQLIAKAKSNIAWIYKNQSNFVLAHMNLDESMQIRKEIGDAHGVSNCLNVLGVIYLVEKKYDSAMVVIRESLDIRRELDYKLGISACLYNMALVLEEEKKYDDALDLQMQALGIEKQIGNSFSMGISYNSIGSLYTKKLDLPRARQFLTMAEQMAREAGSKTLTMNNHYYWADYYEKKGDLRSALDHHRLYAQMNDSIFNDVSATKLAELQALYQLEKKDQEIKLLNQTRQLQATEITLQRSRIGLQMIIIFSIVLGLLLVSLLALKTYQFNKGIRKANKAITEQKEEIQSQSEELIEANATIANINKDLENKIEQRTKALTQAYKELDTFFYRSSHDFRRPLTTFLGLAEVAYVTVRDPNALELFDKVRETAVNLDKMLVKLQSISDVGSQELVYKEVFLKEIFDNVCDSFRDEMQRRSIKTSTDIKLATPFISYPAMVKTVVENLVENAIHFCGAENCYIKLKAYTSGSYVVMDIQDNGQGIGTEYHDQVFDMYFRASERSKGNGLGLYIVKKAVEKLEGSITLSSVPGAGTTFTVMFPNNLMV
jgi:signal transduction histidine kinase/tetratricopeptide (TPR) repeat protein